MFKDAWAHHHKQADEYRASIGTNLKDLERQTVSVLDRIMDTTNAAIIKRYEEKLTELELEKLIWQEKATQNPVQKTTIEQNSNTRCDSC